MVRISHNITFWPLIITLLRFTMTTAWFVNVVVQPPPPLHQYRWTIRNSFINTIQQQQQQQHHNHGRSIAVVMLSLKTDDTTTTTTTTTVLESTAKSTSETSIKIRALASFISMNMLESMLAAGIPIEKLLSMTSLSSSTDSSSSSSSSSSAETGISNEVNEGGGGAVIDDTLLSVKNSESSTLLHQKEGDRIIAMQDTFNTDDSIASSIQLPNSDTSSELLQEFVDSKNSEAPIGAGSMMSSSSLQQQQQQLLLIPEIPSVISKAFGRPLPVIIEHVPSMQSKLPSPITSPSMMTMSTTNNNNNEMNDISQSNEAGSTQKSDNTGTTIRTDMKVVTDEDPYGE